MRRILAALATLTLLAACSTTAPVATPSASGALDIPTDAMRALMQRDDIVRALALVERDRDPIVAQWRVLTEIPAPSGHEAKRADYVETRLREYGLTNIRRDVAGNVFGTRKGTGGGPHVVLDAHLDTVFPLDTNLTTRIENGRLHAPGVGDATRNVAALLAMIRALNEANVQTKGDLTFSFTVEEETSSRGVEQFLADHRGSIDRFIALDGGYSSFTYGGTGIYWYRYHILGPGGHTRSSTPPVSATLPLARAVQRVYALTIPESSWMNIGMLGGADVFNAKASDAWMSVDLRSTVQADLQRLDGHIQRIVEEEAARAGMTMRRDKVSTEEVASMPGHRQSEMVRKAEAVYRAFGFTPEITNTASNHTSNAIRAGVPAIGIGVAPCERAHALDENCEIEPMFTGIKRTLVLGVAMAE